MQTQNTKDIVINQGLKDLADSFILALAEDNNLRYNSLSPPIQTLIINHQEYILAATLYYLQDNNPQAAEVMETALFYLDNYYSELTAMWSKTRIINTFILLDQEIA